MSCLLHLLLPPSCLLHLLLPPLPPGLALYACIRLEEAVHVYNKALMEHRNADTLKKLNETEKMLKVRGQARGVGV